MLNNNPSIQHNTQMPKLVTLLLSRLANSAYRDELIGDLQEEYSERQQANRETTKWLLRQTALAVWDGQKAMVKTTGFVKTISVILCLLVLPIIVVFVGFLSNVKEPSEQLWQLLLTGEVHQILFSAEYWHLAFYESGVSHLEISMFMHIPSIFWALAFAASAYLFLKNTSASVWLFTGFALAFILIPYLFGYSVINFLEPAARKTGPILAFMMLAPFFTLPVYVGFLFKRFSK